MRRRDFLGIMVCAAAAIPSAARGQSSVPVVGFLRSSPAAPFGHLVTAFRQGLADEGFVEGRDVAVEYRWADNDPERLPALAAELVELKVAAIVGNGAAVDAARAATGRIPIVFVLGHDPVRSGLVESLSRPGGNLTGVTFFGGGDLGAKRLEFLHEITQTSPSAIAVLQDPNYAGFVEELPNIESAAKTFGRELVVVPASSESDFAAAFATITEAGAGALLVGGGPYFTSKREQLVALASSHRLPAIYDQRDYVTSGGLVSYAASFTGAYRQAGAYVGRILKGANPAELPVQQPTNYELVINLKTAKELGVELPSSLMLLANEIIE